jgi:hypothetical protein
MRALPTLLIAGLLVACAPVPGEGGVEPVIPILANDPDDLVDTMEWGRSPATDGVPTPDVTFELMDGSTPRMVRVAIPGGGCRPTLQAQISGTQEAASIELVIGGAIVPEGFECSEILTTHELIITFHNPVALDSLTISARRTEDS